MMVPIWVLVLITLPHFLVWALVYALWDAERGLSARAQQGPVRGSNRLRTYRAC